MKFKCKNCGAPSDREDWCERCGYIQVPKKVKPGEHDWRQQEAPGRPGRLLVQCAKCEVKGTRIKKTVFANGHTPVFMVRFSAKSMKNRPTVLPCPGSKEALEKVIAKAEFDAEIKAAIVRLAEIENALDRVGAHPGVQPASNRFHSAVSHIGDALVLLRSLVADRDVDKKLEDAARKAKK